jgi:hypothetical protein
MAATGETIIDVTQRAVLGQVSQALVKGVRQTFVVVRLQRLKVPCLSTKRSGW